MTHFVLSNWQETEPNKALNCKPMLLHIKVICSGEGYPKPYVEDKIVHGFARYKAQVGKWEWICRPEFDILCDDINDTLTLYSKENVLGIRTLKTEDREQVRTIMILGYIPLSSVFIGEDKEYGLYAYSEEDERELISVSDNEIELKHIKDILENEVEPILLPNGKRVSKYVIETN